MDWGDQLAWTLAAVGISMAASLILFGIWRRGISQVDPDTGTKIMSRDEGIMWMFWACTLWCCTHLADTVRLLIFPNLQENSPITFIRVLFSLTNSLFFILATANLDFVLKATRKKDLSVPVRFLNQVRGKPYWILGVLLAVATVLYSFTKPETKYCWGLDALVNILTIFVITWGFFKSFQKREFPIVAWLSVAIFSIFMVAEIGELLHAINPKYVLARHQLVGTALSVGSNGMVALLFIALTFSWVHEKADGTILTIRD